jgi:hypothetical protein
VQVEIAAYSTICAHKDSLDNICLDK